MPEAGHAGSAVGCVAAVPCPTWNEKELRECNYHVRGRDSDQGFILLVGVQGRYSFPDRTKVFSLESQEQKIDVLDSFLWVNWKLYKITSTKISKGFTWSGIVDLRLASCLWVGLTYELLPRRNKLWYIPFCSEFNRANHLIYTINLFFKKIKKHLTLDAEVLNNKILKQSHGMI